MMRKTSIIGVLCLCLNYCFSQTPVIDTVHVNKCALAGVSNSEIILIDNSPLQINITSRIWTIKDANGTVVQTYTPITNDSISHLFNNPGTYTIALSVSWNNATAETDSITVRVYPQSIPAFVSSVDSIFFDDKKDTICINHSGYLYVRDASYTPSPFGATEITDWEWKLGSLSISTDKNPTLQSIYANLYNLSLKITNEYGCVSDSLFLGQVLSNEIIAHFRNPGAVRGTGSICNKTLTSFPNQSDVLLVDYNRNTYLKYEWDWGDGDTSLHYAYTGRTANGHHSYDLPYSTNKVAVKLKVTIVDPITLESRGCSAEYKDTVTITRPIADFTTEQNIFSCPQDGITGGTVVTFNDQSQGNVTLLEWHFGDTSYRNPNHTGLPPWWNKKNPSYTYWNPGKYDVLLIARDEYNCLDSMLKEAYIDIRGPIGKVSYTPTDSCAPLMVNFEFHVPRNDPMYTPDSIVLNTNGGTYPIRVGNPPFFNPTYTHYNTAGKYLPYYALYKTVEIGDTTELCVVRFVGEDTIFVVHIAPDFSTEPLYPIGTPITFENTTIVTPPETQADYMWVFGNGDTAYTFDGITQYDTAGKYNVKLWVSTKKCKRNYAKEIEVSDSLPPSNIPMLKVETENVKIYPNPTSENLTIEFMDDKQRDIQVLDVNGRILYRQTHYEQIIQLLLENYPAGIYSIIIDNTTYRKFTIVK